ncbi:MAG: hypothetical protein JNK53_01760, partial [Phycisphaerae bacterium]|nr:hypothetical protein [Phycisphaerae bacterium]
MLCSAMCASALALGAVSTARWLGSRHAALDEAEMRAGETARSVGEVLSLRGRTERASLRARPQQDLVARLNRTLSECGAGSGIVSTVAAHGGTTADAKAGQAGGAPASSGGSRYATQQVRVSLRGLRLEDLGKFLDRWRATQPLWTVAAIDLSRPQA